MSNIRFQGNPSGTGTLTIASPNTNSDFTLNLPTANGTIPLLATVTNNGVVFINSSGQATSGSALTFDGTNLGFGGTGQRITGDFTNSTIANRVMFQTSTVNGQTSIGVLPNGTSTSANLNLFGGTDPANASIAQIVNTGSEVSFRNAITGTGTSVPMTFYTGGSERMRLDTSGNLGIGTSSPSALGAGRTSVNINGSTDSILWMMSNSVVSGYIQGEAANFSVVGASNKNLITTAQGTGVISWITGGSERARIDFSGNLLVNTTTNTNNSRIVSNGVVESTTGGFRFPDGTTQTTAAGALTTAAVLNATAGASVGAVGTYALCTVQNGSTYNPGATVAGSSLRYDCAAGNSAFATAPSGTWRCMGNLTGGTYQGQRTAVWLRIS